MRGRTVRQYSGGHVNRQYCVASGFCSSPLGDWVVAGSEDGGVGVYDLNSASVLAKLPGGLGKRACLVRCVATGTQERDVAKAGGGGVACGRRRRGLGEGRTARPGAQPCPDPAGPRLRQRVPTGAAVAGEAPASAAAAGGKVKQEASAGGGGGGGVSLAGGHSAAVLALAVHPSRPLLATGAHHPDRSVRVWAARSAE